MQIIADLVCTGDPALLLYDKIAFIPPFIQKEETCPLPPADELIEGFFMNEGTMRDSTKKS